MKNVYAKFVTDVDSVRMSDWLVEENVISLERWKKIRNRNHTAQDRCRALLSHLFSIQHPRAFLVVREALRTENHYLLEYIDNIGTQPQTKIVPDGNYSHIYTIILNRYILQRIVLYH